MSAVIGYQTPRIHRFDYYSTTLAPKAVALASLYDLKPFQWQENVLRDWLAVDQNGKWVHRKCVLNVRRQQGKSVLLIMRVVFGLLRGERIAFTAHRADTMRDLFIELARVFEVPEFAKRLDGPIRFANGTQEIVLKNGGHLWAGTRAGFGRGKQSIDLVIIDESQAYTVEQRADIEPTLTMSPNPQVIRTGTPPTGRMTGEIMRADRGQAIAGKTSGTCYAEWSAELAADGSHLDDVEQWRRAAPSLGISNFRLSDMRQERADFADDVFTFETECLGIFTDRGAAGDVVDMGTWEALGEPEDDEPAPSILDVSRAVLAVDMNMERTRASVVVAGHTEHGKPYVELIAATDMVVPSYGRLQGVDWLADVVTRTVEGGVRGGVVVDSGNPAMTIADELKPRGVRVTTATFPDVIVGCGRFYDAVMNGNLRHNGDKTLTTMLRAARKVPARDGWKLGPKVAGGDVTGARATVLALWGATTAKTLRRAYRPPRGTSGVTRTPRSDNRSNAPLLA